MIHNYVFSILYFDMFSTFYKKGQFVKAKFPMFCHKKGGKMLWKIRGKGLKLSPTDKRGFHLCPSVPYPGEQFNTVLQLQYNVQSL